MFQRIFLGYDRPMADGSFKKPLVLDLDEATFARLEEDAALAREPVEVFAKRLISEGLQPGSWAISHARLDAYDKTGVAEEAAPFIGRMRASVRARIAAKLADRD